MFRFLIVEDIEGLLEELTFGFSRWFQDSRIDTAVAVEDGLLCIEEADSSGWFYDIAVLDFKLPWQRGLVDAIDETLCQKIKEIGRNTLVIHITGYIGDAQVVEHLQKFHKDSNTSWELIDKKDVKFLDKIRDTAKAYLYGRLIEEQMDNLFGLRSMAAKAAHLPTYLKPSDHRSLTADLADLSRDITNHWNDLNENLKSKIRERFMVREEEGKIHISLLV